MRSRTTALLAASAAAALSVLVACSDSAIDGPTHPDWFAAAPGGKAGSSPTVSSATPAWGNKGQTGEQVRILGSGFEPGAQVTWQRNGVPDPRITVTATTYVSPSEMIATVDIATEADLAFYDIAVTRVSDRKTGIGTEKFEVTLAINIGTLGGNTLAFAVNNNSQVAGYSVITPDTHAFYWSPVTGMVDLGAGSALAIDEAGHTVGGQTAGPLPVLWTGDGTSWVRTTLPTAQNAGSVFSLASDPVTGEAIFAGGYEVTGSKNSKTQSPVLWKKVGGSWMRIPLMVPPGPAGSSRVQDVNAMGQAVGYTPAGPTLWENPTTVTILPGTATGINAIRSDGDMAVGFFQNNQTSYPVYWIRQGATWSAAQPLSDCDRATDVDDAGNILATGCAGGVPAVWAAPYVTPQYLGQLGLKNESAPGQAISNDGRFAAGAANSSGQPRVGVLWRITP